MHAWLELELVEDEAELVFLCLLEGVGVVPAGAAVKHEGVEHGLEEVVTSVVMVVADGVGAFAALEVEDAPEHCVEHEDG
ncbi:hypothetical protein Ptc2401_01311 [Prosthecochloris sp. CIB 2401]|nr:hypothetical protein Ptc2401_01311 [Prosthecochloris sp. CIB 2401]